MQICCLSNLQTFTAKIFSTLFLCWNTQLALAQFQDDFSDNEFTSSPSWVGDDFHFLVTDGLLKLNGSSEDGVAYLSTPSAVTQNASWEFKLLMDFNPSGSNYARVYLIADQANLSGPLNGYFVMIGNSDDEVSLYHQSGVTYSKIIDGRDDILNLSEIELNIKVTRDEKLGWQLFTDLAATGNYILEGSVEDNTVIPSTHFGIQCTYTATRSDKFFFDDFNVQGNTVVDDLPPNLTQLDIISSQELKLIFSEPLDFIAATKTTNYGVDHSVGNPVSATLEPDQKTVLLTFQNHFPEGVSLALSILNVADLTGNIIETLLKDFIYIAPVQASPQDIIITEIFPDPSPSVGLPEVEFVELYNRSEKTFMLSGWKFSDESSNATLPDFTLLPNEYMILTSSNAQFSGFENVLHLQNFPALNNANDVLVLKDERGITVDSVTYSVTWYKDDDKSEGGWTLEIIDPNNSCSGKENWIASEDPNGGTPGFQNSVFANKPDLTGPTLRSAIPLHSSLIQLRFDETLQKELTPVSSFHITPSIPVHSVSFSDPTLTSLQISLDQEIQTGITYTIEVSNLYDCAGNLIDEDFAKAEFGLPETADSLEVLVNEILFNPRPTGVDFLEIVNNSSKFLNLKDWSIATIEKGVIEEKMPLTADDFLFKPGSVLAITENTNILKGEYLLSHEQNFLSTKKLPRFNDDQGSVALVNPNGNVIDYLDYTKDMHSKFIKDDEGVSLERISLNTAATTQNWKSASATVGFATPGYLNSNAVQNSDLLTEALKVEPEIFNPLGGTANFALIHYNFEHGGYVANVKVFDSQGRIIKDLANNDILGTTGFYRWDGDRDDGTKATIGYYMIWFEIFDGQGSVRNYQKRVAIAGAF